MKQSSFAVAEALESRRMLAAVYPSAVETYVVELINRARANPNAEVARYATGAFNDLNEGISDPADQITADPKQPVAINPFITDAARQHSQWMINADLFAHEGPGGNSPGDRMTAAGYSWNGYGENIAWSGTTGTPLEPSTTVPQLHEDLFVDEGIVGRGHRINILDPGWREVGAGVVSGAFTTGSNTYNAVMLTTDFGYATGNVFLTGVAYTDLLTKDEFYTVGEGLAGVTITATRGSDGAVFTTQTWDAGAYGLALPPGTYTVTGTGGGLGGKVVHSNVVINGQNVKRDFRPDQTIDEVLPTASGIAPWVVNGGGATHDFHVRFSDNVAVDANTLDDDDVSVTGPNGYSANAVFVSVDSTAAGTPRVATYRVAAPGGKWDSTDNGTYTINVKAGQVMDTTGNAAAAAAVGSFKVDVPYATRVMKGGGDFNKDGKQDILWHDTTTGDVEMWLMDGSNVVQEIQLGTVSNTAWHLVGAGSFNGDSHDDILWRHSVNGQLALWTMNGTSIGVFSTDMQTVRYLDWKVVGTGNFNGDAHTDIVWRNNVTRGTLVWLMNGKGRAQSTTLPTVRFADWTIGGTGDFSGDGRADLMWRNTSTGQNLIWRMSSVHILGVDTLSRVPDSNWLLSSVSDVDGNGTSDLLWRRLTTGSNNLWLMENTSLLQSTPLPFA